MKLMQRPEIRYWSIVIALFVASLAGLLVAANNTLVRVDMSHSRSDTFKVYWTTAADASWTESKSAKVYVSKRKRHHSLRLPIALSDIKILRIDPGDHKGVKTAVQKISLHSLYTDTLTFGGRQSFADFEPIKHVTDLRKSGSLTYMSTGNDPGFVVDMPMPQSSPSLMLMLAQATLITFLLLGLISIFPWLIRDLRWVPAGMLIAGCAILSMAMLSKYNAHPDEFIHIKAAEYYSSHSAPPQVCAEDTRDSYSVYGFSRLNNREIAYYVGGLYLQLLDFVPASDFLKLRMFNVALFFVLILLSFMHLRARYIFLPLLLTPQAWYLFSYYNSDALSLFVVSLTAYQIFVPQSMLRQLLKGVRPPAYALWVLGLAALVAMQYWLKLNYVFYPVQLGMLAASWWLINRRLPGLGHSGPLWLALLLGSLLFMGWEANRHAISDFDLAGRIAECSEQLAAPAYKPSTPLEDTHYNLALRDKGLTFQDILTKRNWAERIFYTGLGAYGYTEYLSQNVHYEAVAAFIVALMVYVMTMLLWRGDAMARMAVLSTVAVMFGLTAALAYQNWTQDFQPQGRYLMAYLPMLGTLMVMYRQILSVAWLSLLAMVPFLMGLYSFFTVALLEILK